MKEVKKQEKYAGGSSPVLVEENISSTNADVIKMKNHEARNQIISYNVSIVANRIPLQQMASEAAIDLNAFRFGSQFQGLMMRNHSQIVRVKATVAQFLFHCNAIKSKTKRGFLRDEDIQSA
ncbi:CLUMA_CG021138, isoform A [Clunio marinus]|uniref:CLUMA_CG021138, isoform A n=1 Tax=Clunio marinus TaxID=568069 RepID=A0A1J1J8B7_9DIPT|nr:CLUMA_CG021138, isoform A [Clunio marinus]